MEQPSSKARFSKTTERDLPHVAEIVYGEVNPGNKRSRKLNYGHEVSLLEWDCMPDMQIWRYDTLNSLCIISSIKVGDHSMLWPVVFISSVE